MADLLKESSELLRSLGVRPQKRRGQNFMVDSHALGSIADAAAAGKDGVVVLEIGPGLGFLTRELLARGLRVCSVEKDRVFARYLEDHFKKENFRVFENDILKVAPQETLGLRWPVTVAANIPYNITSPILEWLIGQRAVVSRAVLTVQWEVALRLTAEAGTKEWGSLSVFTQTYAQAKVVRKISKNSFFPVPKVDSAVVELVFSKTPRFFVHDEALFFKIVRRSFQKRRKTALNALTDQECPKALLEEAFRLAGLKSGRRAETFTIPEWALLSDALAKTLRPMRGDAIL